MSLDFITIVAEIHSSLVDNGHGQSKSISNDTLGKLTAGVNSLKQDKQQRLQKIQELGSALNELWNLLEISVFDRKKFEHVTCYIRSSVDEVSWPGSLSQDVIKQAETEVARLNILKGSKMELVSKKQTELEEVFKESQRETLISDSGCAAREHSPQYPEKVTLYGNKRGRGPKLVSVYVKEAAGQQKSGEVDINHCYGYSTFALDIQNLCEELPDERPTPHVCSPWFPMRGLAEYYTYTKQGVEIINPLNKDWGEFSARVDYVIILPLDTNLDVINLQLLDSVDEVRETMPIFKTLIKNHEQLARVIYFYSCSHAGIEPGPIPKEDSRRMSDDEQLVWGFAECSYYDDQDVKMEVQLFQDYIWAWRMSDDEFLRRLARICIRDVILE